MYDRNNTGTVSAKDLSYLLRAVGQNPSNEEIEEIISSVEQSM